MTGTYTDAITATLHVLAAIAGVATVLAALALIALALAWCEVRAERLIHHIDVHRNRTR